MNTKLHAAVYFVTWAFCSYVCVYSGGGGGDQSTCDVAVRSCGTDLRADILAPRQRNCTAHRTSTEGTSLEAQRVIQQAGNLNCSFQGCEVVQPFGGLATFRRDTSPPYPENGGDSFSRNFRNYLRPKTTRRHNPQDYGRHIPTADIFPWSTYSHGRHIPMVDIFITERVKS
jgi:hypothetical protein